ncbi:MAG: lasso peptide biosynthesis B2 protein [Myxococcota bacterium]
MGERFEMCILVMLAAIGSRSLTVRAAISLTRRIAGSLSHGSARAELGSPAELPAHGERLANTVSRVVPRSNCLDRAMATRVWWARRGIDGSIVVGVRRREGRPWEGHAWLERGDAESSLFLDPGDAWRATFREEDL